MKLAVTYPDAERLAVDYLTAHLDDGTTTVGRNLPAGWTAGESPNHLQVLLDGTPTLDHPVTARATVRLVAWARSPTQAKALAARAMGVLAAHPGGAGVAGVTPLTGPQPAFDPTYGAELAAVTLRVTVRSSPIT